MAVEPWIDQTDEQYWQETITQDLELAEAFIEANQLYLSGYTCYEAIKKVLSCWFIKGTMRGEPPGAHDLVSFARGVHIFERISGKDIELLEYLDKFLKVSNNQDKQRELGASLTRDTCCSILARTNELRIKIENIKK